MFWIIDWYVIRHDQHRSTQYHESDRFQGVAFGGLLINLFGIMCLREEEGEALCKTSNWECSIKPSF